MPMTAKGIAKGVEESGEVVEQLGRLICLLGKKLAYFHTNEHPDGKGPLDVRLVEEIGDTIGSLIFIATMLRLDTVAIDARADAKIYRFAAWENDPDNNIFGVDNPPGYRAPANDNIPFEQRDREFE